MSEAAEEKRLAMIELSFEMAKTIQKDESFDRCHRCRIPVGVPIRLDDNSLREMLPRYRCYGSNVTGDIYCHVCYRRIFEERSGGIG